MTDILDNEQVLLQRDPSGALGVIAKQFEQARSDATVQAPEHDGRQITSIVVTGMGGSALAALIAKVLLAQELSVPFDIIRGYHLPGYVNANTLVIASSYSGNTEETLTALEEARAKGAQIGILSSGGRLLEQARDQSIAHVALAAGAQPRMAMIANLRALFAILANFSVIEWRWVQELEQLAPWLEAETAHFLPHVPTHENYAKQIALELIGKSPVFYGSPLTAPLAYKWKISWNETAKNVAFWNEFPEFNHNEFMGWVSHPIEKPYSVVDILSSFDTARIRQRFELTDRLLSGKRPHANTLELKGDTLLAQLVWGAILADFASVYAAVLNHVDPTPVVLIEKLKKELAEDPRQS